MNFSSYVPTDWSEARHAQHDEFAVYRQFREFRLLLSFIVRMSKIDKRFMSLFPIEVTGIIHQFYFLEQINPFKSQTFFKLSNDNQTIEPSKIRQYGNTYSNSDIARPYALGQTKFIPYVTSNVHYWEIIIDKKPASPILIGISSSNIDTFSAVPYQRVPCVCAIDICSGKIYDSKRMRYWENGKPFQQDERIGFLLDFTKSNGFNGCIRIFRNGTEIDILDPKKNQPFLDNLNDRKIIWEEVPPFSLFVAGSNWTVLFQCTIVQNPQIPKLYKHLFAKKWQNLV